MTTLWDTLQTTDAEHTTYVLLDAAAHRYIHSHIHAWQPPATALSPTEYALPEETAPWLVRLEADTHFTDWFLNDGFFQQWGVVLHSTLALLPLAEKLASWLVGQMPTGERRLLRYYDATVIYAFLEQLTPEQRQQGFSWFTAIVRPTGQPGYLERITCDTSQHLIRQAIRMETSSESTENTHAEH